MPRRLLPAGVAVITAAAAFLLGQHKAEGRPLVKKHRKVVAFSMLCFLASMCSAVHVGIRSVHVGIRSVHY